MEISLRQLKDWYIGLSVFCLLALTIILGSLFNQTRNMSAEIDILIEENELITRNLNQSNSFHIINNGKAKIKALSINYKTLTSKTLKLGSIPYNESRSATLLVKYPLSLELEGEYSDGRKLYQQITDLGLRPEEEMSIVIEDDGKIHYGR